MSLVNSNPLILAAGGDYQISRSVRLRSSASAYFNRTPSSASNQQKFTFSFWAKRGALTTGTANDQVFFGVNYTGTNIFTIAIPQGASENLRILNYTSGSMNLNLTTTQVFRDCSAWYHFVVAIDTTQATSSNRALLYVNGQQVTAFSTATYPAQNANLQWNITQAHAIGRESTGSYFDGYLAEINFVDGQALTPSSFGETNPVTGVWQPKKYTGTYGTNGFFLTFQDNSAATATTIGKDYSGNGNNWTPNNISVTAGSTYDSMLDVPTLWADGGNGRGNYCVLNPVSNGLGVAPSNGNMRQSGVSAVTSRINSTIGVSSGKWYFEATLTTASSFTTVGIGQNNITNQYPGNDALSYAQALENANSLNNNVQPSYGTAFSSGDVFICAFDLDNNKLFFGRNGTWFGSSDPVAGTNPVYTLTAGTYNAIARPNPNGFSSGGVLDFNFGQRPFAYTPPTGFKALNTGNLPEPTIVNGAAWMAASLYTGNAGSITVTNTVNGTSFQPDMVWIKARSSAFDHKLVDSVRGSSGGIFREIDPNLTAAETVPGAGVNGLTSTGFTIGGGTNNGYNGNGTTFVAWQWRANGTPAVTNTAGSITSTVSASTTSGFSVATYTGTGANATVGHGLGVAPRMIIFKRRSATANWAVYHASIGNTGALALDLSITTDTNVAYFNNTSPTSSVFTVGTGNSINASTSTYVAYCFAEVAGFSAFGSYAGNSNTDGPFIYCGFRPRWILVKKFSGGTPTDWHLHDTSIDPDNISDSILLPNSSSAELTNNAFAFDILSNGFKLRTSDGSTNGNTFSYIYAAFAENPFRNSLAR